MASVIRTEHFSLSRILTLQELRSLHWVCVRVCTCVCIMDACSDACTQHMWNVSCALFAQPESLEGGHYMLIHDMYVVYVMWECVVCWMCSVNAVIWPVACV